MVPSTVSAIRDLGLTERALWRRRYRLGMRVRAVAPSAGEPVVLLSDGDHHQVLTASGRPTGRRRVEETVDAAGLGLGRLRYSVHAGGFWQVHRDAPGVLVALMVCALFMKRLPLALTHRYGLVPQEPPPPPPMALFWCFLFNYQY